MCDFVMGTWRRYHLAFLVLIGVLVAQVTVLCFQEATQSILIEGRMHADTVAYIAAGVTVAVQFIKMAFSVPDNYGGFVVAPVTLILMGVWVWSNNAWNKANAFELIITFFTIATSASGIFGWSKRVMATMSGTGGGQ